MQRPFHNGHKCAPGCTGNGHVRNGRGRWQKATALFWSQNVYLAPSQFCTYTCILLGQRGAGLESSHLCTNRLKH